MINPIRAIVMGLGITSSALAQNPGPEEKPKVPPASKTTPADKAGPSHLRTVIDGEEEINIPADYPGTLELNNITVNNLIRLIEKTRADGEPVETFVIRAEAGQVILPRIVTQKKGLREILENLPAIEPKLGVEPLPNGGYVILSREAGTAKEEKTFAAFGLKEYLNRLSGDPKEGDSKAKEERRERAVIEIQKLIEDAFELQGITKEKSASQVSIRIHPSTGVLLATGTPKQLTVISTTLQALGIPGNISGGHQEWAPRYAPGMPGGGGMMGGGMGAGSMGGGFGGMGGAGGSWGGSSLAPSSSSQVVPPVGSYPVPYYPGSNPSRPPLSTAPVAPSAINPSPVGSSPRKPSTGKPTIPAAPEKPTPPVDPPKSSSPDIIEDAEILPVRS